ncbi:signal transduction protein [mine drainage metagenome]|uniref:Signal transduction protein n=1 Tax=mine drainage metagenome TaxID=410659 RepID=T1C2I1_9ZZZZ
MNVEQLMTPDPITVAPQTPVAEIAQLLLDHRINGVPVVDREGRMLGIITAGDLIYRAADETLGPRTSIWRKTSTNPSSGGTQRKPTKTRAAPPWR